MIISLYTLLRKIRPGIFIPVTGIVYRTGIEIVVTGFNL